MLKDDPAQWSYFPHWLLCTWVPEAADSSRVHTVNGVSDEEKEQCSKINAPLEIPKL